MQNNSSAKWWELNPFHSWGLSRFGRGWEKFWVVDWPQVEVQTGKFGCSRIYGAPFQAIHNYSGSTCENSSFTYYDNSTEQKLRSSMVESGKWGPLVFTLLLKCCVCLRKLLSSLSLVLYLEHTFTESFGWAGLGEGQGSRYCPQPVGSVI